MDDNIKTAVNALQIRYDILINEANRIQSIIIDLKNDQIKIPENTVYSSEVKEMPDYNKNFTWQQKILFALGKLGKSYTNEIVDYLMSIDDSLIDKEKTKHRVTHTASVMYTDNKIKSEKEGKKNRYYI